MSKYRIYVISLDGHIISSTELSCSNDKEAIEQTQCLQAGQDVEIWNDGRFVAALRRKITGYRG
jgi:hypothetical protein